MICSLGEHRAVANPAHLEKLCEGPKAWNAWREANPNVVPDLSEIQLTLHQRQLGPSNGGPIDLHAANLEHAILRYATLTGADLEGSRLVGADLTHARLDKAKLNGADLTDAVLDQADLTGAVLDQTVLFGADLSDTRNLTLPQIEQAFGDASTKLPSNLLAPESWFPLELTDEDEDDYAGWGMAAYEEPIELSLYEVLGLTEKASSDEIRTNYRNLVKKLHPDLNPNDEEAQERFKQVTTAYRILNDAEQRARYDKGEIDGEGKVNPEFEARRRFRRTAFRYYTAAAASFMLACGVLVGVWYTVLSLEPQQALNEAAAPQVAVISPKRSERLGEAVMPPKIMRPEKDLALLEQGGGRPDEPASGKTDPADPQDTPAPQAEGAGQNPPAEPPVVDTQAASPAPAAAEPAEAAASEASPPVEIETAQPATTVHPGLSVQAPTDASSPAPDPLTNPESAASPEQLTSLSPPPLDAAPGQAAQAPMPAAEPRAAIAQSAPQKGTTIRPLREGHNGSAGQTKTSAPESWSVAALPSSAHRNWLENAGNAQAAGGQPRLGKSSLPRLAPHPAGRDLVSQVLRARAIRQAFGEGKRPFAAAGSAAAQGRRTAAGADFPTNALPGKAISPTPTKPTAASLQRKPAAGRPASGGSASAAASKPPLAPQAQNRESRQQQAVSDILAGGL
jgi:curved DNA-binding protein CbpA